MRKIAGDDDEIRRLVAERDAADDGTRLTLEELAESVGVDLADVGVVEGAAGGLRDVLIQAANGNPVSADDAWALLHAWDALTRDLRVALETVRQQGGAVPESLCEFRYANVPARTLQPGDRTEAGVVKCVVPSSGLLGIVYEDDPSVTWRIHHDSPIRIEVAS